jgi:lysyl-tRNA synthetase class 2
MAVQPDYEPLPPLENLARRSRLLAALRAFFAARDFLEVETPVRIRAPAQEEHVDAPPAGGAWLRASPELQMKRLLAAGARRIYQIGPCFRAGERGRHHAPEFTLLEWYRAPGGAGEMLEDCRALLRETALRLAGDTRIRREGTVIDVGAEWERLTVREAFRRWAGWDPVAAWDAGRFNADLAALVEPALPRDRPCVLCDYPAPAASLARLGTGDQNVAERWELYLGGMELANAYGELTDAREQRRRFEEAAAARRRDGRDVYPLDEEFLADLAAGRLPPCGGIALGVDRLAMLFSDAGDIAAVRPFCPPVGGLW